MALKLKYTDEHGIVHINMSPKSSPRDEDIQDPKFDTINNRFGQYDLFGTKYEPEDVTSQFGSTFESENTNYSSKFSSATDQRFSSKFESAIEKRNLHGSKSESVEKTNIHSRTNLFAESDSSSGRSGKDGGEHPSLFRSRYNSIEEELANTPYAFATERSLRSANKLDITIDRTSISPSKDIEDNRYFSRRLSLEYDDIFTRSSDAPAFTVTQLIHAQDRYFDLSSKQSVSDKVSEDAFKVLNSDVKTEPAAPVAYPVVPTPKRKNEKSFAILTETPSSSRPTSPRSLPVDLPVRVSRVSPFKGRGFREETSRHTTPKTSAANSRNNSPPRRRTNSLSKIDKMATATLPPPIVLPRSHSPRDFVRENIDEVRGLSELNREKHEAEAEQKRIEEEEALLAEMALQEKISKSLVGSRVNSRANSRSNSRVNSRSNSRANSRSNSPSKIKLQSRSNSPSTALKKDNASKTTKPILAKPTTTRPTLNKEVNSKPFINKNDGMAKPVTHRSRPTSRPMSKSQPQSNDGSPKHSKIPKRQSSLSPVRIGKKKVLHIVKRPFDNNLDNQRLSSSTSSIHEIIKVGSQIHDKRNQSQSSQNLSISPKHIKGKPPISPGRGGPPPSNRLINAKRLSPIVGTPNKSPIEDLKPGLKSSLKPTTAARKPVKPAGGTPATSRINSRQPTRATSRDTSPDKRKATAKTPVSKPSTVSKPITRTPSNKSLSKPTSGKTEPRKPISRTDSMKSLTRTPSNLTNKPPLKKIGSKTSLKSQSNGKINEVGKKNDAKGSNNDEKEDKKEKTIAKKETTDTATDPDKNLQQDNETQYDKLTNEKGELVIMTKKNIVSMTTAAITSQPLEIVTTVTNQLPTTFEKAREKGIFERLGSKDSLMGKDDDKGHKKDTDAKIVDEKKKEHPKLKPIFTEDHKLKPLQGPFNDPQLEKVRQKIDNILKTPEISRENILTASAKFRAKTKEAEKEIAEEKAKKEEQKPKEVKEKEPEPKKEEEEKTETIDEIRTEATKIVESIITPVEEPAKPEPPKEEKKIIEPVVTVVKEKKKKEPEPLEKVNEALVKGDAEVEVQSSNVSTPGGEKLHPDHADGSDKSQSNGGFPQSTSTTPKPPARTKKEQKEKEKDKQTESTENEIKTSPENEDKKPNICSRLMGKCKSKCCPCCVKGEAEDEKETQDETAEDLTVKGKQGMMSKFSCCKKKTKVEEEVEREIERAAGKAATIEFEDETKRKRKFRDLMCCLGRRRRVGDSGIPAQNVADVTMSPRQELAMAAGVADTGCCGRKRQVERRDSILSDRPPTTCCNSRLCAWVRGACRRRPEPPASRRASLFSKNKSLSPTLPPEDTRKKLDPSLVEHTSMIRAAVPVLPIVLAYFCLVCNVVVPGLGSIFSGMFCLCFGIPRFGVHDGAKYRIGSFVVNLLVGVLQLFTVLFCLVGWGWSIWWGVIMLKVARKYRRLRSEARAEEAAAARLADNNHTRA